jgi:signal transduction histidine kinase/DNA-binding response OmpR family regulator
MSIRLLTVAIRYEQDVVAARQRARQIAELLGFDQQDQVRISTAVSEIARNAYSYAGGGEVSYTVEGARAPQVFVICVQDRGPGIRNLAGILAGTYRSETGMGLGILGARRLMDRCEIRPAAESGTEVVLTKIFPSGAPLFTPAEIPGLMAELAKYGAGTPIDEVRQQNRELMETLDELRQRQEELVRLNRELEDTNRGVVALYAELDERADHLRRADEMKSRFLSNMSHEFRTPLNSMKALSKLLLDHSDGPLTGEQERQVVFIRKAAQDLSELVDDLLDLAKIEAGKTEVKPGAFTVDSIFSALRGMLRPLLVNERVALRFEEAADLPGMYTDEAKVSQILRNFISNALKFTELGEVRVSARLVDEGRAVAFSVSDTGIGIDPEHHAFIFNEFTQVPGVMQGRVKGTGLGLPLCKKLAELLGGALTMESAAGLGSTFCVRIPVRYAAAPDDERLPDEQLIVEPDRIPVLILEDDPATQLFYEKILRATAYHPIAARTLPQARDALRRMEPAAILLDIKLENENTWHWLSELKNNPDRQIPVIVATNLDDPGKGYALGADVYLQKPLERETLIGHLNQLTKARVLIIDDDEAARYTIRKCLDPAQYHVIEAENGEAGLKAAAAVWPELIVLDLHMPDISGEEVLRRLKAAAQTCTIPVIIATSRKMTDAERSALSRRAAAVLSKSELSRETLAAIFSTVRRQPVELVGQDQAEVKIKKLTGLTG